MQISELQIALIAAGAAGVALVWGYNVWQDRQHRKTAERIFNGDPGDALLGAEVVQSTNDGERLEPHLDGDPAGLQTTGDDQGAAGAGAADQEQSLPVATPSLALPVEWVDEVADCVMHLTVDAAASAPEVRLMQDAWAGGLGRPVRWLARNADDAAWRVVDADDSGRYRDWVAALQLVDRRGPIAAGELARFFEGVQQIARQTAATLELPDREQTLLRAGKLDEFCASVDIQFVLHVVEASGGVFAGTKLRGVAEAAGLALESDGVFRARDEAGGELFSVANLGAERLDADTLKSLATHGLTLSLDVPRVGDGVAAFDRMLATARQLTTALGGVLVDAQRAPLSDAMIDAIRARTAELQQRMHEGSIVPGSARALRLFS